MWLIFFRKSTKELVLSGSGLREVGHGIRLGRQPYVEMIKTRKEVMVTKLSLKPFISLECWTATSVDFASTNKD